MSHEDNGAWIGQARISLRPVRVMIECQYVRDSIIDVFSLVQKRLTMESRKIFIEVDSEKVETSCPVLYCFRILLYTVVVMLSRFKSKTSSLPEASCVPRYEQDGDPFDLMKSELWTACAEFDLVTLGSSSKPPSLNM